MLSPLAAIRQMIPGLGAPNPTATAPIPAAELEKLAGAETKLLHAPQSGRAAAESGFAGILGNLVEEVNAKQIDGRQAVQDLQSGQSTSLHQTMIALEEASISFQLMVEVRNKVLESYQELMRMQI